MASKPLFPWSTEAGPLSTIHTFSGSAPSCKPLLFDLSRETSLPSAAGLKRRRTRRDLCGEGKGKQQQQHDTADGLRITRPFVKRRRLQKQFMTSPLSRPYSHPASYICGRGLPRIALWARFGTDCRSELRRSAITNALRTREMVPNQENERQRFQAEGRVALMRILAPIPKKPYIPLPPSPCSLTNYAAMDEDEDVFSQADDFHDSDEEDDYDFGFRIEPEQSVLPDYDAIGSIGIPQPPSIPRYGYGPGHSRPLAHAHGYGARVEPRGDPNPLSAFVGLPTPPPSLRGGEDDGGRRRAGSSFSVPLSASSSFSASASDHVPEESHLNVTAGVAAADPRGKAG